MSAQTVALAHSSTYGDSPHEHNGVDCQIAHVQVNPDDILPPPDPVSFVPVLGPQHFELTPTSVKLTAEALSPCSRGPPA